MYVLVFNHIFLSRIYGCTLGPEITLKTYLFAVVIHLSFKADQF